MSLLITYLGDLGKQVKVRNLAKRAAGMLCSMSGWGQFHEDRAAGTNGRAGPA